MKRILVLSDMHCGAMTGITPPEYQVNNKQAGAYDQYKTWIDDNGPYYATIVNGDAIDGTDKKGGGVECITTNRNEQVRMAKIAIEEANCNNIHIIAGTPYHVGNAEDFEETLAEKLGATFRGHGYFNIEGIELNVKHKLAGASMPYLKLTPLAKEIAQNRNWYLEGVEPKADVIIRSHTHHYSMVEAMDCIAFCTPGLQTLGGRYGSRQCSSPVHFGLLILDIHEGGIQWKVLRASGESQRVSSIRL